MSDPIPQANVSSKALWARVLASGGDARDALRVLESRLWYPVYAWWRRAGLASKKAIAATQACFERWLGPEPPAMGQEGWMRMREWVQAQLTVLAGRGVKLLGSPPVEVDEAEAASRFLQEPELPVDEIFQRRWALTILEDAVEKLRAEFVTAGHTIRLSWLLPLLGTENFTPARFSAIAVRTGLSVEAVLAAAEEFRKRHRALLLASIADTVATQAEVESELAMLLCNSTLGGDAPTPASELAPTTTTRLPADVEAENAPTMKIKLPGWETPHEGPMMGTPSMLPTMYAPMKPTPVPRQTPRPVPVPVPNAVVPPAPARQRLQFLIGLCVVAVASVAGWMLGPGKKPAAFDGPGLPAPSVAPGRATPVPEVAVAEPVGEVTFANSRYRFVPGALPWSLARSRAEKLGGHLVVVDTRLEDDFLRKTYGPVVEKAGRFILMGAHRSARADAWQWVNGAPWEYTGWARGEPGHAEPKATEFPVYAVLGGAAQGDAPGWMARVASEETKADFRTQCRGFIVEWTTAPAVVAHAPAPPPPVPTPVPVPALVPAPSPIPLPITPPPSPAPAASAEFATWLAGQGAQWQATYERDVLAPHTKAFDALKARLFPVLDRQVAAASQAGKLENAISLRAERQRMNAPDAQVPAEDEAVANEEVKKWRADFRKEAVKLENDRDDRARALHAKYDQFLAQTQTTLTQRQKLDEALIVKNLRDEVAATWVKAAPPVATPPLSPAPVARVAALPKAAKIPKRTVIEQLLARNATVTIRERAGRAPTSVQDAAVLKDDDFEFASVVFRRPLEKPEWTDEDTALLDQLDDATEIGFASVEVTDAVFERLRGYRNLTGLRLANLQELTAASAQLIASHTGLQSLSLNNMPWPAEVLKEIAQHRKLEMVEFENMTVPDETFAAFLAMPSLDTIKLTGAVRGVGEPGWQSVGAARKLRVIEMAGGELNAKIIGHIAKVTGIEVLKFINRPITDADIAPLAALTKLRALWLDRTKVTGAGFAKWPVRTAMHHLDLRGAGRVDEDSLKAIAAAFTKIEVLDLTAAKGQLTPAAAAQLARMRQLRALHIFGDGVTDECAVELAKAGSIEELHVGSSVITEAGLLAMAKMDRLTRLNLNAPVISDATLKALGKFRTLKELLTGTATAKDVLKKLRDALPGVTVR